MIRPARVEDAEAVAALINAINELGPGAAKAMTPAVVRRDLVCAQPKAILRVAEESGSLIGFATAGLIYDAERCGFAMMLLDLYVEPAFRRRGHARALMADLAAEALRQDARCLWWGVDEGDDEAILFYRSIGARSEGMFSGELIEGAALAALAGKAR